MNCPNCGNPITEGQKYCPICGTNLDSGVQTDYRPKKKKKKTGWIIAILLLCLCGGIGYRYLGTNGSGNHPDSVTRSASNTGGYSSGNTVKTTPKANKESESVRPEIKEALDALEDFYDEYLAFATRYAKSSNPLSMLGDYSRYMEKAIDASDKLDEIADLEMNKAEEKYYLEVLARINDKNFEAMELLLDDYE